MKPRYNNNTIRISHHHPMWRDTLLYIIYYLSFIISIPAALSSCAIKDDIPYPVIETEITAFEVEGMCDESGENEGAAIIDKNTRTISVHVNDLVDINHLKISHLEVTNDALVIVNDTVYRTSNVYPTGELVIQNQKNRFIVNANYPVPITLRTWQDYKWQLKIEQVVTREVEVEGQIGDAIIDPVTRICIIYVSESQDLSKIKFKRFSLGGQHGSVSPDPTAQESMDFTTAQIFNVKYGWSDTIYPWEVYVYTTQEIIESTASTAISDKGATVVSGSRPNGVTPVVEYKALSDAVWTTIPADDISYPTATTYEVEINNLHSDVQYIWRVTIGSKVIEGEPFYFIGEQLENSSFDNWHLEGTGKQALYCPWGENEEPYWDTGNHGATTVGASNSTYVDEDGRRYANLQSKFILVKFAAGNIFTGEYIETEGTNGVLSFGRPFTSRPVKLQFDFQYKTSTITRNGGKWNDVWGQYISRQLYEGLKGQPDSCSVYIALGDWIPEQYVSSFSSVRAECPYLIRTRPKAGELHLMDTNSPNLIGYAQMTCGKDVNTWTTVTLDIDYRNERTPKYIIVVAASSKYGDYFTGGEESLMKIDNLRLIY